MFPLSFDLVQNVTRGKVTIRCRYINILITKYATLLFLHPIFGLQRFFPPRGAHQTQLGNIQVFQCMQYQSLTHLH